MSLLQAVIFSSFWAFGLGQTKPKQHEISITRARDKSAHIYCKVPIKEFGEEIIYWYRQKPDQSIKYLIYVSGTSNRGSSGGKNNKFEASKNLAAFTSTLKVNFLEKEDEAVYYCAFWTDTAFKLPGSAAQEPSPDIGGDILITQLRTSITKKKGNTAFLECQIKTGTLKKNVYVHWYRQKPDQPIKRILYISSNENVVHEQGVSEERYEARKPQEDLPASLRIHRVKEADAGLYYCACWDTRRTRLPRHRTKTLPRPEHAQPSSLLPPEGPGYRPQGTFLLHMRPHRALSWEPKAPVCGASRVTLSPVLISLGLSLALQVS